MISPYLIAFHCGCNGFSQKARSVVIIHLQMAWMLPGLSLSNCPFLTQAPSVTIFSQSSLPWSPWVDMGKIRQLYAIIWVVPLPTKSHHEDYYILSTSRGSL